MKKTHFIFPVLLIILGFMPAHASKIDRKAVVDRNKVITTSNISQSPAQVGNGEFAIGVDITGLQTFTPHYTMSHWSWHSFPLPEEANIAEFKGKDMDTHGRKINYCINNSEQPELSEWLAGNPHRYNLGRIAFILKKANGQPATLEDLKNTKQEIDMWKGIITSTFELDNTPVTVKTISHATQDVIGVEVESALLERGQISVEFTFPYPMHAFETPHTMNQPKAHLTTITDSNANFIRLKREMDDAEYNTSIRWSTKAELKEVAPHTFDLTPKFGKKLTFTVGFSKEDNKEITPDFAQCEISSINGWEAYWKSGAAIDLSESSDPRWKELERRIVLSQYIMRVNEAGSYPSQESGLVNNGWYGRFHFEMNWWHGVHYALWDRWPLFDKCLHVYPDFMPTSAERAKAQGYKGVRWPKCTADIDRDWPHEIHALLIWQQPHPIYFAELDYRLHPTAATLEKWKDVVFASADFMADYAFFDKDSDRFILGPPMVVVSENTDSKTTINPTFELGYWRFGLRVAQLWRERLAMPREEIWDNVLNKLAPLPIEENLYVTHEGINDMWKNYAFEHPALTGVFGMLPGDGVDNKIFTNTLSKVFSTWDFNRTWGWDFPMIAMAAARTGNPDKAIEMLLHKAEAFQFDEHGLATGGPFPYFPSNGAFLTAIGMMTGGWDGSEGNAPGFPKDNKWVVKHEGFNKMP